MKGHITFTNHCGYLISLDLATSPFVKSIFVQKLSKDKRLRFKSPDISLRPFEKQTIGGYIFDCVSVYLYVCLWFQ